MGNFHKSLDEPSSSLIHRQIRIYARHAAALANVLIPLASLNQTATLGTHAGVMSLVLLIEVFGKLGAYAPDVEQENEEKVSFHSSPSRHSPLTPHRMKLRTFLGLPLGQSKGTCMSSDVEW